MLLKNHNPDDYITYLLAVQHRIDLNPVDEHQLTKYMLGTEGENRFFNLLSDPNVKLRDLTLELTGRAQYDIIVICDQKIFHFDIKNFSGTYKLHNEHFISERGNVHTDLLSQLTRAETILRKFLQHHQFHYEVISRIVFINTNFSLKQYNESDRILFHNQLTPIIQYFNRFTPVETDIRLGRLLTESHLQTNYDNIHYYPFDQLKKGGRCPGCRKLSLQPVRNKQTIKCSCGFRLSKQQYIDYVIREISLLTDQPLRTSVVAEWCGLPEKTVRRHLMKTTIKHGSTKGRIYTLNHSDTLNNSL